MPSRSFLHAFFRHVADRPDAPALSVDGLLISYAELAALVRAAKVGDAQVLRNGVRLVPAVKTPETIALVIACLRQECKVLLPSPELGAAALAQLADQVGAAVLGDDAEPGLLLTTSGSTGTPKAVELSPDGVGRFIGWAQKQFGIGPGSTVLNYAPLNFDLCLLDVWAVLAAGGRAALVDQARAANANYLFEFFLKRDPTVVQAVPLFYRLLADATPGDVRFDSVEHVVFTGDAMPLQLLERLPRLFPRAELWNVYGCTETNDSFAYRVELDEVRALGAVPIGTPITGVDAVVEDGTGELLVRTPFQARGYTDSALNAEKWRADGFFRSGDVVRRTENGLYFLVGRNAHHVKVRGVRTNLGEIEQVIISHPDVREAAVVAVPDDLAGNVLHAVVRRQPDSGLNSIGLRVHCAAQLPRTSVPGVVEIVDHALPRTSTGKVDRNLVRVHRERMQLVD